MATRIDGDGSGNRIRPERFNPTLLGGEPQRSNALDQHFYDLMSKRSGAGTNGVGKNPDSGTGVAPTTSRISPSDDHERLRNIVDLQLRLHGPN